jgi:hypothetical protein
VEANHNAIITESKLVAGVYTAPTAEDRVEWWARKAFSVDGYAKGAAKTVIRTWGWSWLNSVDGWDRGLDGFARRLGTREFEVITGNGIEAGVGALWGEDPRYFRSGKSGFGSRIRHAVTSGFMAYRPDGTRGPAYARFMGMMTAKSVSMMWYPEEDQNWRRPTVSAVGIGVVGRISSNLYTEFKPELMRIIRRKNK